MNNLLEQNIITMNPTFIFVDGSYYNFYRYFALMQWWKNAYPDEPLDDPFKNEKFVEKFNKSTGTIFLFYFLKSYLYQYRYPIHLILVIYVINNKCSF